MALPATESFTGGSGALSGSWTQQPTTPTVNKNGAGAGIGSSAAVLHFAFWNADVFADAQYSQCAILAGVNTAARALPTVRAAQTGDAAYDNYFVSASSSVTEILKIINGTPTSLGTIAVAWNNGDVVRLEISGTTLTVYKTGGSIGTVQDSALASGSAGCGVLGNVITIDDWEGGNLGAVVPIRGPRTFAIQQRMG